MKAFTKIIFVLFTFSIFACEQVDVLSLAEILKSSGKSWRIVSLKKDGTSMSPSSFANVRYQFNADGAKPTTYSATGLTARGIIGDGDKPNYYSTNNRGNWAVLAGNVFVFDPDTQNPSRVDFVKIPKAGDRNVTIRWTVPEEIDKLIPTYEMILEIID